MVKQILGIMVVVIMAVAVSLLAAEDHKTPTAPKEYIDMKNPFKADKDVIARAEEIYMKK